MSTYRRRGHWRRGKNGQRHWVSSHNVTRDTWYGGGHGGNGGQRGAEPIPPLSGTESCYTVIRCGCLIGMFMIISSLLKACASVLGG